MAEPKYHIEWRRAYGKFQAGGMEPVVVLDHPDDGLSATERKDWEDMRKATGKPNG